MITTHSLSKLLGGALLACSLSLSASAAEVAGVHFDDTTKVAGKELKLNGVGVRKKFVVKVYAAGLYLPEKAHSAADVYKQDGPRRMSLVMLRDVSSDDFGLAYMKALNENVDDREKARFAPQLGAAGQMSWSTTGMKKGDVLNLDWIPGTGSVYTLNGKRIGEFADLAYFNAMLRIWLGEHPVDADLKPRLLGETR
ncbi:MAG: chalcone isomerase family protein [Gammaproteobacteria bacterium]